MLAAILGTIIGLLLAAVFGLVYQIKPLREQNRLLLGELGKAGAENRKYRMQFEAALDEIQKLAKDKYDLVVNGHKIGFTDSQVNTLATMINNIRAHINEPRNIM